MSGPMVDESSFEGSFFLAFVSWIFWRRVCFCCVSCFSFCSRAFLVSWSSV